MCNRFVSAGLFYLVCIQGKHICQHLRNPKRESWQEGLIPKTADLNRGPCEPASLEGPEWMHPGFFFKLFSRDVFLG